MKQWKWLFVSALALILLAGCSADPEPPKTIEGGGATAFTVNGTPLAGTGKGTAEGYNPSVEITVTLTLVNGFITNAVVTGSESFDYGQPYVDGAGARIVQKNSVAEGVDAVASPTPSGGRPDTTIPAIKKAGKAALEAIAEKM